MENYILINVGIKNTKEANLWLRAAWSMIRKEFGRCSWFYMPNIKTEQKLIHLGKFQVEKNIEGSIEVYITYKQRGGISNVIFQNYTSDLSSLKKCLNSVKSKHRIELAEQEFSVKIDLPFPILNYIGECVRIQPINKTQSEIVIKIQCYDTIDGQFIAKQKYNIIIDLLASIFWRKISISDINREKETVKLKYPSNTYSDIFEFSIFDEYYVKDNIYFLPKKLFRIINEIVTNDEYNFNLSNLIKAVRVYHSALKVKYLERLRDIDLSIYEITVTHYMSVLEILSMEEGDSKHCKECHQEVYSISKRVRFFLNKVFPNEDHRKKSLNALYNSRSEFLHSGKYINNDTYVNAIIPQLSNGTELLEYQNFHDNGFIKHSIGMCIEFYIKNLINPS
ncbi:hypothetical protein V9L05_09365 [Bernardetia sp. Wsw4-3y2]|uniref:hypothetical protein n=1 Tax=Bernardetia sp. Wsw4-3y2 TaxID=3127471 RepID=UPI0030CF431D